MSQEQTKTATTNAAPAATAQAPAVPAPAAPAAPGSQTPPAKLPYYKTGEVDWDSAGGRPGRTQKMDIVYLKMKEGASVNIRLVGKPFAFYKHWSPIEAVSPGPEKDVCWMEGGHKPRKRYSCWVIDRADGQVKLFDFGPKVLDLFSAYKKLKQRDPGGEDGPNWTLSYEVPETVEKGKVVKNRRDTKWMVLPDAPAPLTPEEKKKVEEIATKYPLAEVRKPASPERIKEFWEEAKRNPEGPIPGSHKWWVERREQRIANHGASGGAASSGGMFDSERQVQGAAPSAATPAAAPAASEAGAGDDYDRLFAEHGEGDDATLF